MNIEFFSELNYDNQIPSILTIDIDENLPIGKLLSKIHEITKIPLYTELKWDGYLEKISCRYYFKFGSEFGDFKMIEDLEHKISDFPKNGSNHELSLYIDGSIGLVN
jgi:hypothetical protein